EYFKDQTIERYVDKVFPLAKLKEIYMTNDPLDPQEWPVWNKGFNRDQRFKAVLRLDSALMNWPQGAKILKARGYKVQGTLCQKTYSGIRKYLNEWCDRMSSCYMAISLPPTFRYPDKKSALTNLFTKTVLATARERKIPVAMMIGVKKLVNPNLRLAGDSVGRSEIETLENLACDFSDVKFLVTMLSRENMHELCVTARKFKNIIIFGCWWFLNNPSLIREITAMRLELLGLTFVPQHSDARVLDQLIYKWGHSREIISRVLSEKYLDMAKAGGIINEEIVRRDVNILFDGRLVS
ncbi:MAG: glucuronate isomerase, partial [Elusimicrobiota bacterium]